MHGDLEGGEVEQDGEKQKEREKGRRSNKGGIGGGECDGHVGASAYMH